jgi:FtsP/CotA-like multicopper oxidase with cupredoxin domain
MPLNARRKGRFVYHCHAVDYEEGMMDVVEVVA